MTHDDFDWNAIWIERQIENRNSGRGGGCQQTWMSEPAARRYWQRAQTGYAVQERLQDLSLLVNEESRILDIGAGPGNLALPLAQKAAMVSCVEPADGMVKVLRENSLQAGIGNIQIIHKTWDDIDIKIDLSPPYQLCFASYSLGMLNLRESIEKMCAVTNGTIILYWHAGNQPWDKEANHLWPLLHQKPYFPIPKCDVVFNLLYQMGIYAHVQPIHSVNTITYNSYQDALEDYKQRFEVNTREQENLLQEYLSTQIDQQNGQISLTSTHNGMKIWWINQELS